MERDYIFHNIQIKENSRSTQEAKTNPTLSEDICKHILKDTSNRYYSTAFEKLTLSVDGVRFFMVKIGKPKNLKHFIYSNTILS